MQAGGSARRERAQEGRTQRRTQRPTARRRRRAPRRRPQLMPPARRRRLVSHAKGSYAPVLGQMSGPGWLQAGAALMPLSVPLPTPSPPPACSWRARPQPHARAGPEGAASPGEAPGWAWRLTTLQPCRPAVAVGSSQQLARSVARLPPKRSCRAAPGAPACKDTHPNGPLLSLPCVQVPPKPGMVMLGYEVCHPKPGICKCEGLSGGGLFAGAGASSPARLHCLPPLLCLPPVCLPCGLPAAHTVLP